MYAIFSKEGRWIGYTDTAPTDDVVLYKEVPVVNITEWVWEGSFEDGELKRVDEASFDVPDKTVVFETNLIQELNDQIDHVYPPREQVRLLIGALHSVIRGERDSDSIRQFKALAEYIKAEEEEVKNDIAVYKEDPNFEFVSKEEEKDFVDEDVRRVLNTEK